MLHKLCVFGHYAQQQLGKITRYDTQAALDVTER